MPQHVPRARAQHQPGLVLLQAGAGRESLSGHRYHSGRGRRRYFNYVVMLPARFNRAAAAAAGA